MNSNAALVITSISAPNAVMRDCAEKCREHDMEFIVIGDAGSPENFQLDGCRYYDLAAQKQLPFKIAELLPEKHYARKNLGYLLSKEMDLIVETDDDNFPTELFWGIKERQGQAQLASEKGWVNTCRYFSDEFIWPRGFPLEQIRTSSLPPTSSVALHFPVQQGMADNNPDVDAVYRMTQKLPVHFKQNPSVALDTNCWCPFNSQNTSWFKEAFPLLYLPVTCSFRMTDIWRSFIAQRIAWTCGWNILFHSPTVTQERNEHDLLKDFEQEIQGYLHGARICRLLEEMNLDSGVGQIPENLLRCYQLLVRENVLDEKELPCLDAWLTDIG